MTPRDKIAEVLRERLPGEFMTEPLTYIVGQETEPEATNRYWNKKARSLAEALVAAGVTICEPEDDPQPQRPPMPYYGED